MAGGGADRAIGVDGHDVQIAHGEGLHKGAELGVHQLQQLAGDGHHIGLIVAHSAAPAGGALVRHGDKVHILHLQPAQVSGLGKPQDILEAQVRLHALLEHLGKLVDLADVLQLQKLLHHGFQQCLLGLDPAQVPVRIAQHHAVFPVVVAVAQHLHGVFAGEQAIALFLVDGQILIGVVIVHVPGHVKPDAAHGLHDLAHGLPLHDHLVVRLKAHQLGDLLIEMLDALIPAAIVIVHRVDPLDIPGDIDHGIPWDGHDGGLLVGDIVACKEHGVGVSAAAGVPAQDQHRVVVLALALAVAAGAQALLIVQLLRLLLLHRVLALKVRTDEQGLPAHHASQHHRQADGHSHQNLLLSAQTAGLFGFLGF